MLDLIQAYENYLVKVNQASANTVSSYMRDIRQYENWLKENEEKELMSAMLPVISPWSLPAIWPWRVLLRCRMVVLLMWQDIR